MGTMDELNPVQEQGVNAHIQGIIALLRGAQRTVTVIISGTRQEHRDELRKALWEQHGEDVYDPTKFGVHRLPHGPNTDTDTDADARAAVPADALMPSFAEVPDDTTMIITVPMLTRALRTWDEESHDKGWSERRDDETRHAQNARYIMGIMDEHRKWAMAMQPAIDEVVNAAISGTGTLATLGRCDSDIERLVERLQKTGGTIEITVYTPDTAVASTPATE